MIKNIPKSIDSLKIAVIGLGYVGLPLAIEFGKKKSVIGFDINKKRILNLKQGVDNTLEVSKKEINCSKFLKFTNNYRDLRNANCFIVTVPTPIKKDKKPNLIPLNEASKLVGKLLKIGDLVIYESTVFPGATEDNCVPILEKNSCLKFNKDFFCGYSPERINPGDKKHKLTKICKITSGSNSKIADIVDLLYKEIIEAGTYKAESIKVAEAAKVIENTQRDINISLINEFAMIFKKMNIDTQAIIKAASTKWNFHPYYPGLVGGHCIGVDPYYLTYKAKMIGYNPKIILAGRNLNDKMDNYIVSQFVQEMKKKSIKLKKSKILVLGMTFKENCPDIRNSKVIDVIKKLNKLEFTTEVYDPYITEPRKNFKNKIKIINKLKKNHYHGIIIAVGHKEFKKMGVNYIRSLAKKNHVLFDVKYTFKKKEIDFRI